MALARGRRRFAPKVTPNALVAGVPGSESGTDGRRLGESVARHATPLGWALYDCLVEKRHPEAEFARVVKALLEARSPLKGVKYPTGDAAVDEVLHPYI